MNAVLFVATLLTSPSILECDADAGSYVTGCRVSDEQLGTEQPFESTFSVDYSIECAGDNRLGLVLVTESGEVALPRGIERGQVQVTGARGLRLKAADAGALYRTYFARPCVVEVLAITASPSAGTLQAWQAEGRMLSDSMSQALELWKLSGSVERVLHWDDDQLMALKEPIERNLEAYLAAEGVSLEQCLHPDGTLLGREALPVGWGRAVRAHPEVVDFAIMLEYVEATIRGRPPVSGGHAVADAAARSRHTLVGYYYDRLLETRRAAANFVQRLERASQSADADLVWRLREIESQLKSCDA